MAQLTQTGAGPRTDLTMGHYWIIARYLDNIMRLCCETLAHRPQLARVQSIGETLPGTESNMCNWGRWSMELNICSIHFISCQGMIVISVIQVQECGRYYTGDGKTSRKLLRQAATVPWDEGMLFCLSRC